MRLGVTRALCTILEARRLVLVATGDAKADAVAAEAALRNRQYYDDAAGGLPD